MVLHANRADVHNGLGLSLEIVEYSKFADPEFPQRNWIEKERFSIVGLNIRLMCQLTRHTVKHETRSRTFGPRMSSPHSGEYPIPYGKAPPEAVTPHPLTDVTDDLKVVASCGQIGDRTVPRSRSYFSMREGSYDLSLLRSSNWAVATRMARNVRSVSNVI